MSHYRKIDVRIWNDEKFNDMDNEEKLAFIFVLTHPNMTSIGAMRGTVEGLAAEIKALPEAFHKAFDKGMLKVCKKSSLIVATNFMKYNQPESPNVVKAWAKAFSMLPECELKNEIYAKIYQTVKGLGKDSKKAFLKAFDEAFPEGYGKEYA
jgi:hypothetical protein